MKSTKSLKVLIAQDYDPTAQKIAAAGFPMAKAMNAEITLLHAMSDLIYYASTEYSPIMERTDSMGIDPLQYDSDERLKKEFQHFLEKVKHLHNDESVLNALEEGDFDDSVLMNSKGSCADILMTGVQSHRWLQDLMPGSVTQKVVRPTSVPVYIIPTKKRDRVLMI